MGLLTPLLSIYYKIGQREIHLFLIMEGDAATLPAYSVSFITIVWLQAALNASITNA